MNSTTELPVIAPTVAVPGLVIHPSISPLAAELLLKTAEQLAANPKSYNQGEFSGHRCGTPCCILGHMAAIAGLRLPYDESGYKNAFRLGLTVTQYTSIFNVKHWPAAVSYIGECGRFTTAEEGIARIEIFLETAQ